MWKVREQRDKRRNSDLASGIEIEAMPWWSQTPTQRFVSVSPNQRTINPLWVTSCRPCHHSLWSNYFLNYTCLTVSTLIIFLSFFPLKNISFYVFSLFSIFLDAIKTTSKVKNCFVSQVRKLFKTVGWR